MYPGMRCKFNREELKALCKVLQVSLHCFMLEDENEMFKYAMKDCIDEMQLRFAKKLVMNKCAYAIMFKPMEVWSLMVLINRDWLDCYPYERNLADILLSEFNKFQVNLIN